MSEKVGYLESKPGHKSMMRLLALLGFGVGTGVAVWSMALIHKTVNALMAGNVQIATVGIALISTLGLIVAGGLALAGGGEALKVIQQRGEAKQYGKDKGTPTP